MKFEPGPPKNWASAAAIKTENDLINAEQLKRLFEFLENLKGPNVTTNNSPTVRNPNGRPTRSASTPDPLPKISDKLCKQEVGLLPTPGPTASSPD